jgi:hypothetical protein
MIIYRSIFGDYDPIRDSSCDVITFTESNSAVKEIADLHPRMKAKYFKMHPVFDFEGISVYIDGSAEITIDENTFKSFIKTVLGDNDLSCFIHPEGRTTIQQEADYCYQMPKYADQKIHKQVQHYINNGFQDDKGLFACGMMIYRNNARVRNFLKDWWTQNKVWTYQDQLSFPYCLDQHPNLKFAPINLDIFNNIFIHFNRDHLTVL